LLNLKYVNKFYGSESIKTQVLKNINLDIEKGEFIVILGPSGSGKTTLLNIIGGLEYDYEGSYIFNSEEINKMRESKLIDFRKDNVGFVYQAYNLLPSLTVDENIKVGQNLSREKNDINELIKLVGLAGYEKKYPYELSGGEQQRVSIARAIAKNPNLLLADEPTGALDEETSYMILDLFKKLNKLGTTILLITHNNEIAEIADRVIKMNSGKIVEVMENKNLKKGACQ